MKKTIENSAADKRDDKKEMKAVARKKGAKKAMPWTKKKGK